MTITADLVRDTFNSLPQDKLIEKPAPTTVMNLVFRDKSYADHFLAVLGTDLKQSDWIQVEHELVKPMTVDDFERNRDLFSKAMDAHSRSLIETDLAPGWLARFNQYNDLGIKHCMSAHHLPNDPSRLVEVVAKQQAEDTMPAYYQRLERLKNEIGNYSDADLTADLADFLYANWEGFDKKSQAQHFARHLNSVITEEMTGKALELDYDCVRIMDLFQRKKGGYSACLGFSDEVKSLTRNTPGDYEEVVNKVTGRLNVMTLQDLGLSAPFQPKGFKALKEQYYDDDFDAEAVRQSFTPCKGLDLKHDMTYDLNQRLHPLHLLYQDQEHGYNDQLLTVAWAVTATKFYIAELRWNKQVEDGLLNLSDDVLTLKDDVILSKIKELITKSKALSYEWKGKKEDVAQAKGRGLNHV